MTPDARGAVNAVLYMVQFDSRLDDTVVERIAGQLRSRPLAGRPVEVTRAALREALASDEDVTGPIPQPHDEATCRAFLARLVERLADA